MSVTTTANTTTQSILHVLADYELTHSGEGQQTSAVEPPNPRNTNEERAENPEWWPEDYNAIPPYRPINYNLDRESRPWAQPGIETAFVWTMLNGVGVVSVSSSKFCQLSPSTPDTTQFCSKAWRQTGGRLNDRIFRFSIGGER
jgi:hypothetical protein